jgi:AcrR family transcriptional regulator
MDSLLDVCGESGYRQVTVETIYRHYGGSRLHFYRHFASKADCFSAAYSRETERLLRSLTCFEADRFEDRVQEALASLAAFVTGNPLRARALFVEVHVAGGDVLGKRREVFERLSRALNKAGRETKSRHSVPPLAGEFMINVVDQAVSSALIKGEAEEFSRMVPELTDLICQAYGQ